MDSKYAIILIVLEILRQQKEYVRCIIDLTRKYVIYQTHSLDSKKEKGDGAAKKVVDFYDRLAGKVKGIQGFYDDRQLRRSAKSS